MKIRSCVLAAIALAGLSACGPKQKPAQPPAPPPSAVLPMTEGEKQLRTQIGQYYFDFEKNPTFKRFTPTGLGLSESVSKRFERAIGTATPSVLAKSGDVEAIVFAGCVQHNCGDTIGVLAIEPSSGDVFVGLKDERGAAILKPSPRLQKLLEDTSPSHAWTDPLRG